MPPTRHDSLDSSRHDACICSRGSPAGTSLFQLDARGSRKCVFAIAFQDETGVPAGPGYRFDDNWDDDIASWDAISETSDGGEDEFNIMWGGIYHVRNTGQSNSIVGTAPVPSNISFRSGSTSNEVTVANIGSHASTIRRETGVTPDVYTYAIDNSGSMNEADVQPALDTWITLINSTLNTEAVKAVYIDERWLKQIKTKLQGKKET